MKINGKKSAFMLALFGAMAASQATTLITNVPTASVDMVAGSFGGVLLNSSSVNISNVSYSGIARSAVYRSAGGSLDFYYQFSNSALSQNGIERFSGYDFSSLGALAVDVFQTSAAFDLFVAGTENSDYADRTATGVIGFSFVPNGQSKILPGSSSFTQIIRTSATNYQAGNFAMIDGIADNAASFAPAAPVPEPETYAMLLAGLGLVATIVNRRKSLKQDDRSAG